MLGNRWRSIWSKQGAALTFADTTDRVHYQLDPGAVGQLLQDLRQWLTHFEAEHGTLWNVHHQALGHRTLTLLDWPAQPQGQSDSHTADHRMLGLLKNLPLDGFERSVKLRYGQLLDRRFLLGLPSLSLALQDLDWIAQSLRMPQACRASLLAQFPASSYLHFGLELDQTTTYKIYLESTPGQGTPLYQGWKWLADEPTQHGLTRYIEIPLQTTSQICDAVRGAWAPDTDPALMEAVQHLLQLTIRTQPAQHIRLVQVRDDTQPRVSIDINLYACDTSIGALAEPIRTLCSCLNIPTEQCENLLIQRGGELLGHLSAGMDARKRPFVTLYHAPR